jgi:hypothetical protein
VINVSEIYEKYKERLRRLIDAIEHKGKASVMWEHPNSALGIEAFSYRKKCVVRLFIYNYNKKERFIFYEKELDSALVIAKDPDESAAFYDPTGSEAEFIYVHGMSINVSTSIYTGRLNIEVKRAVI